MRRLCTQGGRGGAGRRRGHADAAQAGARGAHGAGSGSAPQTQQPRPHLYGTAAPLRRLPPLLLLTLALVTLATNAPRRAAAQGLVQNGKAQLGASRLKEQLEAVYRSSRAWRDAYVRSAGASCSRTTGSLCASGAGRSIEQRAQLLMATSPRVYDARSAAQNGGFSAVGQPKDQARGEGECNTCVAFTILAAAQSAVACALRQDAASRWSEQDFFFCKSLKEGEVRRCSSSWSMLDGINALVDMARKKHYPTLETCMPYDPSNPSCSYDCQDTDAVLSQGGFSYVKLPSIWEMMEHIRNHGSVITRLDVFSDLKPFFEKNPGGTYPGHGKDAIFSESHAIQLVGYDLDKQSWIFKNSWGTGFASSGFGKIAFGVDGVGAPDDSFGIMFNPTRPLAYKPTARMSRSIVKPGCWDYKAVSSDYVSKVAALWGAAIETLLLDNKEAIPEPDMLLGGKTLTLCGIPPPVPSGGGAPEPAPSPAPAPAPAPTPTPTPAPAPAAPSPAPDATKAEPKPLSPWEKLTATPPPPPPPPSPKPRITVKRAPRAPQPAASDEDTYEYYEEEPALAPPPRRVKRATPTPAPASAPPPEPAYRLRLGVTYKGTVWCIFADNMPVDVITNLAFGRADVVVAGGGPAVSARLVQRREFMGASCDFDTGAVCARSASYGAMCGGGEEAWGCQIVSYQQWADSCMWMTVLRPKTFSFCYAPASDTVFAKSMDPTCSFHAGDKPQVEGFMRP